MIIENKEFNPKTGLRDKRMIAVDDIDEIVHIEGVTFQIFFSEDLNKTGKI